MQFRCIRVIQVWSKTGVLQQQSCSFSGLVIILFRVTPNTCRFFFHCYRTSRRCSLSVTLTLTSRSSRNIWYFLQNQDWFSQNASPHFYSYHISLATFFVHTYQSWRPCCNRLICLSQYSVCISSALNHLLFVHFSWQLERESLGIVYNTD